jgi:hypothetical protein
MSPWIGEPFIMTGPDGEPMLAEALFCTGHVISGGELSHFRHCPVHPHMSPPPEANDEH